MTTPFATLILAGGTGSRMGSGDKHKVCFEVLDRPVILRALETYNLCGSSLNLIVVGTMGEKVMATVSQRFPATAYVFQNMPLGTGDAARKGADVLERMHFDGDVLVVAGDKIIEPHVIQGMLARHRRTGSDVTVATTRRQPGSSAGMVVKNRRGKVRKILETGELNRTLTIRELAILFEKSVSLSPGRLEKILLKRLPRGRIKEFAPDLWNAATRPRKLTKLEFLSLTTEDDRRGLVHVGNTAVQVEEIVNGDLHDNQSTYIFRCSALCEALHALKPSRPGQEEYLTDVIGILSSRKVPSRITEYEIENPEDLMAFNNPEELLAIEEVLRRKEGSLKIGASPSDGSVIAPAAQWRAMLKNPSSAMRRMFRCWYGEGIPWDAYIRALDAFVRRYGSERKVVVIRAPGRINLLGRHIDHQGGSINVLAVNREIIMVASPRGDDVVTLSNTDPSLFADNTFRISDMVAQLDWDDWLRAVDGPRVRRILESARGEWHNYVKAAILRLQERFRHRRLQGMDVMVAGDIPIGAGLSSSSALVVATAEAVSIFNSLAVTARRLVSLCGEGEWFVGTRGGVADHAAIKLSRRGYVTRVGFFPFQIEQASPFFKDHALVVCNSGIYAGKSGKARHVFNEKVTAYHIGRIFFRMLRSDLAPNIEHLRDITIENLGISRREFFELLSRLPSTMTRKEVRSVFKQAAESERDAIERLFVSHDDPAEGYTVRDVVLFGLCEMARAKLCLGVLRAGDAAALGRFMDISHNGDRVSRDNGRGKWLRSSQGLSADAVAGIGRRRGRQGDLAFYPGSYGCSLPEIDRIADTVRGMPGVEGAQMAGAGLGGCVMALVRKEHSASVIERLSSEGIRAEVFRSIAGAACLTVA